MSAPRLRPFPEPPLGVAYLRSRDEVLTQRSLDAYQHLLLRAWDALKLSGVLVIRGIPTVYLREDDRELQPREVADLHRQFWNQGVATILVLIDGTRSRVFSSMVAPRQLNQAQERGDEALPSFVEELNLAAQALRAHRADPTETYLTFCRQVASGHYYRRPEHSGKFNPREMVDAYLLENLSAVRDELTQGKGKLDVQTAHAFLGRLLFTCYLIDRGIIALANYFPGKPWTRLQDLLNAGEPEEVFQHLYSALFPKLKREFNGSMFDDDLAAERNSVRPRHLKAVGDFFAGHEIRGNQRALGFWPYDFAFIPVETISAIYENFLEKEGKHEKRESGAYYTPRFLAEATLDTALEGRQSLAGKRFLDPSCGSGIFIVLLFNRLAAEWGAANPSATYAAKDKALRAALGNLRGVDKNLTACRIACFSVYLAFLDQFTPSDVRAYIQQSDSGKLPCLLRFSGGRGRRPDIPVIWENDFFAAAKTWGHEQAERFDYIIGNPPWAGRGKKQIAHEFMEATPTLLSDSGRACLLLPTKVFFNRTDAFQSSWLRQVTLEKVVQLSDYRFILFTNAVCPCVIARFTNREPDVETHAVEYLTPKVTRVDLRQGVIPIAPGDRKEIPLRMLLAATARKAATIVWKSRFWGTQRDLKFLDHLFALPRLGEKVDQLSRTRGRRKHPWAAGQGCKPWSTKAGKEPDRPLRPFAEPGDLWSTGDEFVAPNMIEGQAVLPRPMCIAVGAHFAAKSYSTVSLYSKPPAALFTPPLVLFNQGFTDAVFFDFAVRFQDSLQSIAGVPESKDELLFLAAYLRSKLARYFVFHTAANVGTERDKVHLDEALCLPFYLPDDGDVVTPKAADLVRQVVGKFRNLKQRMEDSAKKLQDQLDRNSFRLTYSDEGNTEEERKKWLAEWSSKTAKVQAEIEPLLYEYFGIIEQEQALVEETCEIFDKSDTPNTVDAPMPTLEPIDADGLKPYAQMLAETLRDWSRENSLDLSTIAGVEAGLGIALLKVEQTRTERAFKTATLTQEMAEALKRLEQSAATSNGSFDYVRDETWFFDGPRIFIAKPALRGRWTRTSALNDAAEIHATIQFSRQPTA